MAMRARLTPKSADETDDTEDSEPPAPVAEIEPSAVTVDQLSLTWPAATDDVGVIGYRIWLNGFDVATTAETRAKLHWFNNDSGHHVVQIRAIDAAGNQSRSSPTLVIVRPSPEPTPRRRRPKRRRRPTGRPTPEGPQRRLLQAQDRLGMGPSPSASKADVDALRRSGTARGAVGP